MFDVLYSMKKFLLTFFSVALVVSGIAGGFFVGYRAYREAERNKQVATEIKSLEDEANRVDQENRKLRDRIEYLQSDSFREEEAKRVLEYQKSSEKVVLIRDHAVLNGGNVSSSVATSDDMPAVLGSHDEESNPLEWWREFFRPRVSQ